MSAPDTVPPGDAVSPGGPLSPGGPVSPDGAASSAATAPAAGRSRPVRDMALSLAVLLVPIFVLLFAYRYLFAGDAPIGVDATQTWDTARHSATFTVLAPDRLPNGWTVASATFADGTLRVGYVTPAGTGLQVVESDRALDVLGPVELGNDARPGRLVTINDRPWREYPVARGGQALVLVDAGRTVLIVGNAAPADLRTFAAALR